MGKDQFQPRNAAHELGDIVVGRRRYDLLGRADLHDPAVLHDGDAVADADRLIEIMGDENRRLLELVGQLHELILQLPADQRIKRGERLVHQQHLRIGGERARQSNTLLHPTGQLARKTILIAVEIDHRQAALRHIPAARLRLTAHLQRKGDVVAHGHMREQRHVLKDHADMAGPHGAQLVAVNRQDVAPEHIDPAGRRLDQPVDVANHG